MEEELNEFLKRVYNDDRIKELSKIFKCYPVMDELYREKDENLKSNA